MTIRGYVGDEKAFDDIMVEYADRHEDITERDQAQLCETINDGAMKSRCVQRHCMSPVAATIRGCSSASASLD